MLREIETIVRLTLRVSDTELRVLIESNKQQRIKLMRNMKWINVLREYKMEYKKEATCRRLQG